MLWVMKDVPMQSYENGCKCDESVWMGDPLEIVERRNWGKGPCVVSLIGDFWEI